MYIYIYIYIYIYLLALARLFNCCSCGRPEAPPESLKESAFEGVCRVTHSVVMPGLEPGTSR